MYKYVIVIIALIMFLFEGCATYKTQPASIIGVIYQTNPSTNKTDTSIVLSTPKGNDTISNNEYNNIVSSVRKNNTNKNYKPNNSYPVSIKNKRDVVYVIYVVPESFDVDTFIKNCQAQGLVDSVVIDKKNEPTVEKPQEKPSSSGYSGSSGSSAGKDVQVKGYYRKDGKYVAPHTRSAKGSKKSSGSSSKSSGKGKK